MAGSYLNKPESPGGAAGWRIQPSLQDWRESFCFLPCHKWQGYSHLVPFGTGNRNRTHLQCTI